MSTEIISSLDRWEKAAFDNEAAFLQLFGFDSSCELLEVYWSSCLVKVVVLIGTGATITHKLAIESWFQFLKKLEAPETYASAESAEKARALLIRLHNYIWKLSTVDSEKLPEYLESELEKEITSYLFQDKESAAPDEASKCATRERVDLARCLLILLWQAYDAAGHSHGRSLAATILENVMNLLGQPRDDARSSIEGNLAKLIGRAREIHSQDIEQGDPFWFREVVLGEEGAQKQFVEKLRKEIESGFENRIR